MKLRARRRSVQKNCPNSTTSHSCQANKEQIPSAGGVRHGHSVRFTSLGRERKYRYRLICHLECTLAMLHRLRRHSVALFRWLDGVRKDSRRASYRLLPCSAGILSALLLLPCCHRSRIVIPSAARDPQSCFRLRTVASRWLPLC